jgi:hypothetical protein
MASRKITTTNTFERFKTMLNSEEIENGLKPDRLKEMEWIFFTESAQEKARIQTILNRTIFHLPLEKQNDLKKRFEKEGHPIAEHLKHAMNLYQTLPVKPYLNLDFRFFEFSFYDDLRKHEFFIDFLNKLATSPQKYLLHPLNQTELQQNLTQSPQGKLFDPEEIEKVSQTMTGIYWQGSIYPALLSLRKKVSSCDRDVSAYMNHAVQHDLRCKDPITELHMKDLTFLDAPELVKIYLCLCFNKLKKENKLYLLHLKKDDLYTIKEEGVFTTILEFESIVQEFQQEYKRLKEDCRKETEQERMERRPYNLYNQEVSEKYRNKNLEQHFFANNAPHYSLGKNKTKIEYSKWNYSFHNVIELLKHLKNSSLEDLKTYVFEKNYEEAKSSLDLYRPSLKEISEKYLELQNNWRFYDREFKEGDFSLMFGPHKNRLTNTYRTIDKAGVWDTVKLLNSTPWNDPNYKLYLNAIENLLKEGMPDMPSLAMNLNILFLQDLAKMGWKRYSELSREVTLQEVGVKARLEAESFSLETA